MTNYFYDAAHPLPAAGSNATLELADAGTTFIGLAVTSTSGIALQAALKQRIMIGADGSIHAGSYALDLKGAASGVYNEGAIMSDTASALHFTGGGIGSVTNLGTITGAEAIEIASTGTGDKLDLYNSGTVSASGVAIVGGAGDDRVVNVGTLKTTATAAGALAIDLGAGNDFYDGSQGSITGVIQLGAGNDTAYGGAGDETFIAGTGSNHIDGGGGYHDTVDYSFASAAVTLDLHTTNLQWTGAQFDQILNVENIVGSAQADKLTGSDISNSLTGGAGDDTLDGGLGNDTLDGGAGVDTVRYSGSFAVTVSLAVSGDQDTGVNGHDTLIGIENLEGGAGADKLTGSDGANLLKGGAGNDTLTGGLGNDTLDGGSGQDTAVFSGLKSAYTITTNTDGTFTVAGPDGTDTLKDVRLAKFDDQTVALTNGVPSSILLLAGSVSEDTAPYTTVGTLYGSDPDGDTLTYSLMSDGGGHFALNGTSLVLTGRLDYETARQHVVTVLARDTYGLTMAKSFTIAVKNVIEKTPLTVKGTSHGDLLSGEAGNDKVYGLRGDDTLWGDAGNDRLTGGPGNDTLVGGAGKDLFVLDYKPNVKSNVDFFYDFNPKYDTIGLSRKVFSKIKKVSKGAFWIGDHVHDKDDRLLYNKKTGALFYDPDGTGHAAAIQIAELPKKLHLTYKDFILV